MEISRRRILVTGGNGFLGSHVVDQLRDAGCRYVFAPSRSEFDLVEKPAVRRLYDELQPELVFHLAARVGGIGANQRKPGCYFHDNILMGIHVLEEARRLGVEKTVLLGTVCSYPKLTPVPFAEEELWNGYPEETNAPYGVAKKALFTMADAYRRQYGVSSVCLLPVNLYGPRDHFDLENSHVLPAMVRKCVEAKRDGRPCVLLWGDGSPTREFLYVEDCARALVLAAERHDDPTPINIGAGSEISMKELATMVAQATNFEGRFEWDTSRPNGQPRRCVDTSRAREAFGFQARVHLSEGLAKTVDWYQRHGAQRLEELR